MLQVVKFVFVLVNISSVVFLVWRVTFLLKFYLRYNQLSYQDDNRSELRQNMCFSLVIIFGVVCYHDFLTVVFPNVSIVFIKYYWNTSLFMLSLLVWMQNMDHEFACFHVKIFFIFNK